LKIRSRYAVSGWRAKLPDPHSPNDLADSLLTTIDARRSLATYAIIDRLKAGRWGIRRQNSEVSMTRTTIAKRLVFHIGGYDPITRPASRKFLPVELPIHQRKR